MVDFVDLPELPDQYQGRRVFVRGISAVDRKMLQLKGYDPIDVLTLPRNTQQDHQEVILAWITGMSEGTIDSDPERRKTLELEAKAYGLMINRSMRLEGSVKLEPETLEQLLDMGHNTHTLQSSTLGGLLKPKEKVCKDSKA